MNIRILFSVLLLIAAFGQTPDNQPTVTVKASPVSPWIEVYHDGELTSEWQPRDGAIYQFLLALLNDDMYPLRELDLQRQEVRWLLAAS